MEIVNLYKDVDELKENTIIGKFRCVNSKITFKGKGNILYCCDESVNIINSNLVFNGDNAIIILSKSKFNALCYFENYKNCNFQKTQNLPI